jgi:hypothetical protein
MGEPGDLLHHRSRKSSLQLGRLGWRHPLDGRDAKPVQKRTTSYRNHFGIAFVTGITYLIALMFSVQDYAALSSTNTGLPLAE